MRWTLSRTIAALCVVIVIVGTTILGCATNGFRNWDPSTWFKSAPAVTAPEKTDDKKDDKTETPETSETPAVNVEQLQTDLAAARAQVAALTQEKTTLTSQKAALEADKASLTQNNSTLTSQKAQLVTQKAQLEEQIAGLNTQIAGLDEQIAAANEEIAEYEEMIEIYTPFAALGDTGVEVFLPLRHFNLGQTKDDFRHRFAFLLSDGDYKYDLSVFDKFRIDYSFENANAPSGREYASLLIDNPLKTGNFDPVSVSHLVGFVSGTGSDRVITNYTCRYTLDFSTSFTTTDLDVYNCLSFAANVVFVDCPYSPFLCNFARSYFSPNEDFSYYCFGVIDPIDFDSTESGESVEA